MVFDLKNAHTHKRISLMIVISLLVFSTLSIFLVLLRFSQALAVLNCSNWLPTRNPRTATLGIRSSMQVIGVGGYTSSSRGQSGFLRRVKTKRSVWGCARRANRLAKSRSLGIILMSTRCAPLPGQSCYSFRVTFLFPYWRRISRQNHSWPSMWPLVKWVVS